MFGNYAISDISRRGVEEVRCTQQKEMVYMNTQVSVRTGALVACWKRGSQGFVVRSFVLAYASICRWIAQIRQPAATSSRAGDETTPARKHGSRWTVSQQETIGCDGEKKYVLCDESSTLTAMSHAQGPAKAWHPLLLQARTTWITDRGNQRLAQWATRVTASSMTPTIDFVCPRFSGEEPWSLPLN